MWQALGLQPAKNAPPTAAQLANATATIEPALQVPVVEGRSSSPADSEASFTRITIKMEVEEPGPAPNQVLDTVQLIEEEVDDIRDLIEGATEAAAEQVDDVDDVDDDDEEEEDEDRPGSAMSLLSRDSDDDPTWAPEPDLLKKPDKPPASAKVSARKSGSLKSLGKSPKKPKPTKKEKPEPKVKGKRGRKKKTLEEKKAAKKAKRLAKMAAKSDRPLLPSSGTDAAEKPAGTLSEQPILSGKKDEQDDFHHLCTICK